MKEINQSFKVQFDYKVIFTEKLFQISNTCFVDYFKQFDKAARVYFVIDEGVSEAHPELINEISSYFSQYSNDLELLGEPLIVAGGEDSKNDRSHLDNILKATDTFKIDRHSYIAAIGGGAVLDMAGFATAISHRGIRHIRIPTTVLSQNDSGVGVKNGINSFGKKNYLGSFAPPKAVFNDSTFLTTLDDRDWRSGISEAVKVALIKDEVFFRKIQQDASKLAERDMASMDDLIFRCAEMHMDHIAGGDPFEMGSSRPLDFGHWAAHKMEQLSNYEIRHGEAVAIGIALDVTYSYLQGRITESECKEVTDLFKDLGFKLYHPVIAETDADGELKIIKGLKEFQEHLGGELTIMLFEKLGKGVEVHEMDDSLIKESVKKLEEIYSLA